MEERPAIWRVAANIPNKQSRKPTRDGPLAWGLGEVLTTSDCKNVSLYETKSKPRTWTDTLVQPKQQKLT
jgi:hypothetical protein